MRRACPLAPCGRGCAGSNPRRVGTAHRKLLTIKLVVRSVGSFATRALYGRAGPVTFGSRPKSNQNGLPHSPLFPPVLATGGTCRTAHESFADATHSVCRRHVYDRPLLRSSARAEGAFEPILDRFAMRTTRTRMRASGLRLKTQSYEADAKRAMSRIDFGVR